MAGMSTMSFAPWSRVAGGALAGVSIGAALVTGVPGASADPLDLDLHGYAEADLVATPSAKAWTDGGLGKFRWGGDGAGTKPEFSAALLEGTAILPFDLRAAADVRYDPRQKSALDLLDATLRWQPPPDGAWRWSAKLGAFFPPFALENTDLGWSSPWTLTYSALDSWIGEELRTIGGEATVEWRIGGDLVSLTGAVYGWNDPAGVILADRGWDLGDRPLGLFDHLRVPDATARLLGEPAPFYTPEFSEIDNRPGWYATAMWEHPGIGTAQLFRYDNDAELGTERNDVYIWRTRFWGAGFTGGFGAFRVIAEGLVGDTAVGPDGTGPFVTDFHAAYLLGAWTGDPWRVSLRIEQFGTGGLLSEHGRALTGSVNWLPRDWLRVTAEVAVVDSWRTERDLDGLPPRAVETEPRLGLRVSF
jgi:hypothetical protein